MVPSCEEVWAAVSSSTIQERATESQHLVVHHVLPGLRGVKQGRNSTHWTFFCPLAHRKKDPAAAIWIDDEGWISVHCFDCQRNAELREAVVVPSLQGRQQRDRLLEPSKPPAFQQPRSRANPSVAIWPRCSSIPLGEHPARAWFASRNLWRPQVSAPAGLRWLPAERTVPGPHTGAGSMVALLAPPGAWAESWPDLPEATAVEIIAIDYDGKPALDRPKELGGLGKRTLGNKAGSVFLVGNPRLGEIDQPVRVTEGVADALALASRFPGLAVATMGDAGMKTRELASWLAGVEAGVIIHSDDDRPGRTAADRLRLAILALGGMARGVLPPQGKDPADAAASLAPFPTAVEGWPSFEDSLARKYKWPLWEAERQAAILLEEE